MSFIKILQQPSLCILIPIERTHNKGIMNGISALMLATGNDTRSIEAGAHAYASISGKYIPDQVVCKEDLFFSR